MTAQEICTLQHQANIVVPEFSGNGGRTGEVRQVPQEQLNEYGIALELESYIQFQGENGDRCPDPNADCLLVVDEDGVRWIVVTGVNGQSLVYADTKQVVESVSIDSSSGTINIGRLSYGSPGEEEYLRRINTGIASGDIVVVEGGDQPASQPDLTPTSSLNKLEVQGSASKKTKNEISSTENQGKDLDFPAWVFGFAAAVVAFIASRVGRKKSNVVQSPDQTEVVTLENEIERKRLGLDKAQQIVNDCLSKPSVYYDEGKFLYDKVVAVAKSEAGYKPEEPVRPSDHQKAQGFSISLNETLNSLTPEHQAKIIEYGIAHNFVKPNNLADPDGTNVFLSNPVFGRLLKNPKYYNNILKIIERNQ